ncbi:transcriptional regulator, TetR family [Paenibacillus sp. UNC496MF]|uniref:TetR family transcriptional regulator n=1 Tax=Paenibacillus sp. UNC496MF TaxID=1502753 RepID=UPI0008E66973|nr:TetR family transcriptional regulator [Paenibacillus sp. UNC496MF]SFI39742.1 transcriptional regulator, TetR family [Paenibacillus sp. UNC496MF]
MANDLPLSKEQILDTAEQVLKRFGPDKTSVVDVARALQVSHGTLYRHFASKAALREAVTARWLDRIIAEPLASLADLPGDSAADRLRQWVVALIAAKRTYAADDPELFKMYADVTLEAGGMIEAHIGRLIGQLASIIASGIASGELKPGDPEETARAIFIATSKFHHPSHAREWLAERADREFESVWRVLLYGIVR